MKATLEFNLPEETEDHNTALNGWRYKAAIDDIFQALRSMSKYDDSLSESDHVILEKIREKFTEITMDLPE